MMLDSSVMQRALSLVERFQWPSHNHLREAVRLVSEALNKDLRHTAETDDTHQVRMMFANHPDTPPEILDFVAITAIKLVLERIAENPNISSETLFRLANNPSANVRAALAANPNVPFTILDQLSQDDAADVRYALAENPTLPAHVLEQLTSDDNPYIAVRAHTSLAAVKQIRAKTQTQAKLPWLQWLYFWSSKLRGHRNSNDSLSRIAKNNLHAHLTTH